jgi:methionyl aminopeptidase
MHKQSNPLRNLFPPGVVSKPDPATGHYNPFPTYPFTGSLRPVYPLSQRRTVPKSIQHPDYAADGVPRSEQTFRGRNKIDILNKEEQEGKPSWKAIVFTIIRMLTDVEGMRKVCRLAREVLDTAAAALKPGVTTDYIDEVVHKACLERDVSPVLQISSPLFAAYSLVLPFTSQLLQFPKISMHITQRSYLPRHPR